MPHRCDSNQAPTASGMDPFCFLPDDIVKHVLSFLPALDAVRTCVLARRWRHLWRSLPRLRISNERFPCLVFRLREPSSALDECEFEFSSRQDLNGADLLIWMLHALTRGVQMLRVRLSAVERVTLTNWTLESGHLRRLEFHGLGLPKSFLDFLSCPALEDLKITDCQIAADKIMSRSLKHLKITGCHLCYLVAPTRIYSPRLISLQLYDYTFVTPVLESMPLLQTASVKLGQNNEDYCEFYDQGGSEDCSCSMCLMYFVKGAINGISVLLRGLSNATSLELTASVGMVTFKRDLRFCPTFSKLKTLLLNDWCLVADLHALLCFLQHTPILEKLTLQLRKRPKPAVEMEGCNLTIQSLTLSQLKIVVVKCPTIDERVHRTLEILRSCSTCLDQVIVQEM